MKSSWHPPKAERNLHDHEVAFDEAATVFADPEQENFPDFDHSESEARYICLGLSDQARVLFVSYTQRGDIIHLISARRATNREERKYDEARSDLIN